jgi:hypothetical protein
MTDLQNINEYDPKTLLLLVLQGMDIEVIKDNGKVIEVASRFSIEVEAKSLYRLSHEGMVIAPFNDVIDMCHFIKSNLS